jgi:hypothetical protein
MLSVWHVVIAAPEVASAATAATLLQAAQQRCAHSS